MDSKVKIIEQDNYRVTFDAVTMSLDILPLTAPRSSSPSRGVTDGTSLKVAPTLVWPRSRTAAELGSTGPAEQARVHLPIHPDTRSPPVRHPGAQGGAVAGSSMAQSTPSAEGLAGRWASATAAAHPIDQGPASSQSVEGLLPARPVSAKRRELDKLVITISNECNMSCTYCYANDGKYYTTGAMMTPETALSTVAWAAKNFSRIHHIQFFGGEATLNLPVMHLICECFLWHAEKGLLDGPPTFGLTTNAYKMGEHVVELLSKYGFSATVSLDGPAAIHDKMRRSRSGAGTFEAIMKNVQALRDAGIDLEFECTYTAEHERSGIRVVDLMDFFHDELGCRTLHCPMAMPCHDSPGYALSLEAAKSSYADAIHYSIRNLMAGVPNVISIAARMLESLTKREPVAEYCPAGTSSITVNADGNVYTCFLLMDGADFRIAHVLGEGADWPAPKAAEAVVRKGCKDENDACKDCWAAPLCFGCLGEDLAHGGNEIKRSTIPGVSALCDFKRHLVEEFLLAVAGATVAEGLAMSDSAGASLASH